MVFCNSKYIESGKYRLAFYYGFEISSNDPFIILESKAVYSNEFTIKEKTAQNKNVSVVLDKMEYEKGETINGLINFNRDIYINPNISIYKFNSNDWEYLGAWSFDGVQYTCCGAIPLCGENFSKNSPVKFVWDQMVVKGELPILPNEPKTKIQVDAGKYRVRVIYGDQPVCIDGVDVEFTIK